MKSAVNDNLPKTASCPVCKKPVTPDHRPFCSDRCQKVDLGRWLNESYAIPGEDALPIDDGENM